ncbi:MAG: DUF4349 domain-containing protein [Caldilineaceae bacterium]|nr:DUF4349 domain-containing protein [Caldilineaceae bacterium]
MQNKSYRKRGLILGIVGMFMLVWLGACSAAQESASVQQSSPMGGAAMESAVRSDPSMLVAGAIVAQDVGVLARKVVARATMNLVVDDTEQAVAQIQQMMQAVGGYVSNANLYKSTSGNDTRLQGSVTLRVPSEELEAVMAQLEGLAVAVDNKTIDREDVTDQYSDIEAQLRNLEATEVELREMLAEVRAKPNAKPEDILTVYTHLNTIRSQIEQLQGRKNMLNNLVGLSTLELTLSPNVITLPVIEHGWQPTGVARDALRELVSTLQDLGEVGIWFGIYLLPILLIWFIVLLVLWSFLRLIWRRVIRRRPTTTSA